ncbi:MAG TPA: alpha/beta hydrolase [Vitreimonas sp.]|uniref:alpha/beta fold hydrolase n=1 Tax=Vitreimonas sp. TaxID=3069702 RepID=UPI002D60042D|nr:alpha/beta hydrolase [Vitreimonas sp.]HYD88614.1 alpha/beta hydrolase [Vitreimonas sp.]
MPFVHHRRIDIDGVDVFYREGGSPDAPMILLPHGYPCSSYQFRNLIGLLADRWRLVAPDFPGAGYSATPDDFDYSFDGYAEFLDRFVRKLGADRYALYLHDFGSQIGLRLAIKAPGRIIALVIQNGDIYEDALGAKYQGIKQYWRDPSDANKAKLAKAISEEGFKEEFLNEVRPELAERIPPDLWKLHWGLMSGRRREIALALITGLKENLAWFPRYQAYLRTHQPPTLIVWGPQDGYMPAPAARAYLRDLPNAELHLLDAGHWALETNLCEIVDHMRRFLSGLEMRN